MKLLENLKLDSWWSILLYLGIAIIAASLFVTVDFLEKKHLMGLGIGVFLVGFSYKMAEKYIHSREIGGILSTKIIKHNFITVVLLLVGIVMISFFGFKLVKGLI